MFKKVMAKWWLNASAANKTVHPDVYFAAADNHGDALVEMGELHAALQLCTTLRSELVAAVGPRDVRYQEATVNIARALYGLGNLDGAAAELLALIANWPLSLGTQHMMLASAIQLSGIIALKRGEHKSAAKLARQAHEMQVALVGSKHRAARASCSLVAEVIAAGADEGKAETEYRKLAAKVSKEKGDRHADYAMAANNLGVYLLKMRQDAGTAARDAEAMLLLKHALKVRVESLGNTHPHTVGSRDNIACGERMAASRK
jgi:tetratricopeptide (TPR) repeat protein